MPPAPTARRQFSCTATTTCSRRSERTPGPRPIWELTERDGRWYGRGSADCKGNIVMHLTALRALKQVSGGFPCGVKLICEGSEEQGTGGLEEFVPAERRPAARRHDPRRRHRQLRRRRPDADDDAARHDERRRHGPRRSAARCTPACSAARRPTRCVGLIQMLASLHDEHGNTTVDGLDATQKWTGVDYSAEQFRADATVLDGVKLMGDGNVADLLWARPSATVLGIDVPPVIGSSSAVQASAAARISLRLPPGVTGAARAGRARRASAGARAVGHALRDRARRRRRPVRRLARRPGVRAR